MEKLYSSAKIFKVFPRGGALARMENGEVVFLSWFDKDDLDKYKNKTVYFYQEDVERGKKGLSVSRYYAQKPITTFDELKSIIKDSKYKKLYFVKIDDETHEIKIVKRVLLTFNFIKSLDDTDLIKKIKFNNIWDKVNKSYFYIELNKDIELTVSTDIQKLVDEMFKMVNELEDVHYEIKKRNASWYIGDLINDGDSVNEILKNVKDAREYKLPSLINKWRAEAEEKLSDEKLKNEMFEAFGNAVKQMNDFNSVKTIK